MNMNRCTTLAIATPAIDALQRNAFFGVDPYTNTPPPR